MTDVATGLQKHSSENLIQDRWYDGVMCIWFNLGVSPFCTVVHAVNNGDKLVVGGGGSL